MSWSALEVIGLIVTIYVLWWFVSAVWNLLYTCYIGSALGRSINVRKLGSWAGQFHVNYSRSLLSGRCTWNPELCVTSLKGDPVQ